MTAQQKDIGSGWGPQSHSPEGGTLRSQQTRDSPRHVSWDSCCAIIISPFSW